MAYIRCETGGGSPSLTETLLWTNPNPNVNFGANSIATLSEGISNFTFIKIEWKYSKTSSNIFSILIPSDKFINATTNTTNRPAINGYYTRVITYDSNTTIKFGGASALGGAGGDNSYAIPTNIYGVK